MKAEVLRAKSCKSPKHSALWGKWSRDWVASMLPVQQISCKMQPRDKTTMILGVVIIQSYPSEYLGVNINRKQSISVAALEKLVTYLGVHILKKNNDETVTKVPTHWHIYKAK